MLRVLSYPGGVRAAVNGALVPTGSVSVMESYARWIADGGVDPVILDRNGSAGSTALGTAVMYEILVESAAACQRLIDQRVPVDIACDILPHGVYKKLFGKGECRRPRRMTAKKKKQNKRRRGT